MKNPVKRATPDHPIQDTLAERWSPYGFSERPVGADDLCSLFEAARWAPSSYNEQPWRYLVATKDDAGEFSRLLSCLVEGNQAWAKSAPVLVITVARLSFTKNEKPNAAAIHDIGLASANLTFEATRRGLHVHQMIGILPDRVHELYEVPEGYRAVTGIAIGHASDPATLDDRYRERDTTPRTRKPLDEIVFSGKFGHPAKVLGAGS